MTTSTVTPEIMAFAQGVRAALSDLPAEEVDDLTEGLEADLAEAYAEDLQRELPDASAYAAELRSAAGLPVRVATGSGALSGLAEGWRETRRDVLIALRRHPGLAAALEFVAVLRPLWWVVRAWLATWLLAAFFGMEQGYWFQGAWWIVLVALVVISVQWGRGLWQAGGVPALIVLGNAVAVIAILPALAAADDWGGDDYGIGYEDGVGAATEDISSEGLVFNGLPLENIYVYDAKGRPIRDVQLFDVDGKPLVAGRGTDEPSILQRPATLETGAEAYNVFPLDVVKAIYDDNGELVADPNPDPGKAAAYKNGPYLKVPAVVVPEKVSKPNQ